MRLRNSGDSPGFRPDTALRMATSARISLIFNRALLGPVQQDLLVLGPLQHNRDADNHDHQQDDASEDKHQGSPVLFECEFVLMPFVDVLGVAPARPHLERVLDGAVLLEDLERRQIPALTGEHLGAEPEAGRTSEQVAPVRGHGVEGRGRPLRISQSKPYLADAEPVGRGAAARSQGSLQKAPGALLRAGTEGEPRLHECDGGVEARISAKAPRQLPQSAGSLVGTVPDNQTADAFEPRPYESRRIAAVQKRFAARS